MRSSSYWTDGLNERRSSKKRETARMSLHHGDHGQEALFARLLKTSEGHDLNMNCFISGSGDHFFISLMEPSTKQEKWAWAGSSDSIVEGFQRFGQGQAELGAKAGAIAPAA